MKLNPHLCSLLWVALSGLWLGLPPIRAAGVCHQSRAPRRPHCIRRGLSPPRRSLGTQRRLCPSRQRERRPLAFYRAPASSRFRPAFHPSSTPRRPQRILCRDVPPRRVAAKAKETSAGSVNSGR